jgi:hypothetical protein
LNEIADRLGSKAFEAEQARLAAFFKSIGKHRQALELAIEEGFGAANLDVADWRKAFDSADPHDALRTMAVTGSHSTILNSYVEILRASAGSRLVGLLPHRRPHAEQVFEAVRIDGGLSNDQLALVNRLYVLEGRVEHASPDVQAEEVRDAVEHLRDALPELIENACAWLAGHGIQLSAGA